MMKRVFFVFALLLIGGFVSLQAQTEIGVRFGNVTGGNAAVDGVFSVGQFSRVHANVSFGGNNKWGTDLGIDALWDFIYRPIEGEAFNWYVGAGPFIGLGNKFSLGAVGEIGIEYRFNIPLSLSIDYRPAFRLIDTTEFDAGGFGFNVRYVLDGGKK